MCRSTSKVIILSFFSFFLTHCSSTRNLSESAILLRQNTLIEDGNTLTRGPVNDLLIQPPNKRVFGMPIEIYLDQWVQRNPDSTFYTWINKKKNRRQRWEKILSPKQVEQLRRYKVIGNRWLKTLGAPPVLLDSSILNRNVNRILQYYKNNGYFDVDVTAKVLPISRKQASVQYLIQKGTQYVLDSIAFQIEAAPLQSLVARDKKNSLLVKGNGFHISDFEAERKRLLSLFRNAGIYNFQENSLRFTAAIDSSGRDKTIGVTLTVENPRLRVGSELVSQPYQVHTIKRINVFVESQQLGAALETYSDSLQYKNIHFYSKGPLKYRPKALADALFIELDSVYSDQERLLTYRYFNDLENFKYPSITFQPLQDSLPLLETNIILSPKEKFSLGLDFDLSHSNIQFFGLGLGSSAAIRNVFKGAEILQLGVQSSFGASSNNSNQLSRFFDLFELGTDISLRIPRLLFPIRMDRVITKKMNPKTDLSLGFAVQENIGLDKQYVAANYEVNWQPRPKQKMAFRIAEIEFVNNKNSANYFNVYRNSYDRLNNLAKQYNSNSFLVDSDNNLIIPEGAEGFFRYVFANTGLPAAESEDYSQILSIRERQQRLTVNNLIVGSSLSFNSNTQQSLLDDNFSQFRFRLEWVGNLLNRFLAWTGNVKNENNRFDIAGVEPSQYFKTELDYIKHLRLREEHVLAFRSFIGMAIPYGNASSIPFVRSYFAGGTNDNRAWKAYRLGPGSSENLNEFNEANFKIAANLEYRFPLFGDLKGALFVDAGNIWNLWDNVQDPQSKWDGLQDLQEIAIGSGIGLRYDFDFFVFRFDTAFKTYNPVLPQASRWWSEYALNKAVFNIGINYPF
ncbi:MAG: BamA/TamA family outer membrane protein [Flavobacteriaceae bacterium]